MYEPFLLASVHDTEAVMKRPALRYDRTLQYMATIAFHDSRSVLKASDILVKIHTKVVGTEPISGLPYDANDPDAQLWIHLTAWHSVLYTYEKFGPGKLTPDEETQYWEECARAAQFQTINIDDVPRSREQMRAYYQRMRARSRSNRSDSSARRPPAQRRVDPSACLAAALARREGHPTTLPQGDHCDASAVDAQDGRGETVARHRRPRHGHDEAWYAPRGQERDRAVLPHPDVEPADRAGPGSDPAWHPAHEPGDLDS
jgi:ER-bound oxygenase mpaB/B'/Rubber oxygenase, catalytic domain